MNLLLLLLLQAGPARADLAAALATAADAELSESARMSAFDALVEQGYGEELIRLAEAPDLDARQRYVAIRALGRVNSPPAVDALVRLLSDDVSGLRGAAAAALAEGQHREHAEKIAALLKDSATIVRGAAADALVVLADPAVVPALVVALDDPSNHYRGTSLWVRRHFVAALGATKDRSALPALIRCLDDADAEVVDAALAALPLVSGASWADGRDRQEQIEAWRRWWENQQ